MARESAVSSSPGRRTAADGRGGDTGDARAEPFRGSEGEAQASPTPVHIEDLDSIVWDEETEREALRTPPHCVCNLHMYQARHRLRVPSPQIVTANPAFEGMVERRATRLCREAEPHAQEGPSCIPHVSEARRQLFDLYQQQESA